VLIPVQFLAFLVMSIELVAMIGFVYVVFISSSVRGLCSDDMCL